MRFLILLIGLGALASSASAAEPPSASTVSAVEDGFSVDRGDWPWWRGPDRNGHAEPDQSPPLAWSETKNVVWKTPVPGRGHGTPTIAADGIFLATADEEKGIQSVLCYDRRTGKERWRTDVHQGGLMQGNKKASQASSSVACDGERIFINFLNDGAVYTTAFDLDGKQLWQTKITDYVLHQGYGSSPAVFQSLVIVSADNKGGGAVAGLDRRTGKIVWRNERPATPNYPSPIILRAAGRDQMFLTGCDLVSSFDPLSGKKLWEIEGATTECVTSTVTDGVRIFTSGGYPTNHVSAVMADGSGKIAWENNTRVYVPSMLVRDGRLFAVTDAGVAVCWKSDTGEEVWKGRLRGVFTASPVMVGDRIYAVNEEGEWFIFGSDPNRFELLAENRLPGEVLATPVICGGRIYHRLARQEAGRRQEMLYCLGETLMLDGGVSR